MPHTVPESLRPTVGPLCESASLLASGIPEDAADCSRHSCRPLMREALCPEEGSAFCPDASICGQGRRASPVLMCTSLWVKHLPCAAGQNAFKSHFQSGFRLWKPSDGGAWTRKSFTSSHRFSLGQDQRAPCCTAKLTPIYSRSRLDQGPLSDILVDINVRYKLEFYLAEELPRGNIVP